MTESKEKTMREIADYVARVGASCLLMMWGVVNLVFNFLNFRRMDADGPELVEGSMAVAILFIVITGLVPFVIGLVWLWKIMGNNAPVKSNAKS